MSYEYTDPKRANEDYALPDVDVFDIDEYTQPNGHILGAEMKITKRGLIFTEPEWWTGKGYYYAYGFPGCLWDSDPIGPFETYEKALEDARESAGVYDE